MNQHPPEGHDHLEPNGTQDGVPRQLTFPPKQAVLGRYLKHRWAETRAARRPAPTQRHATVATHYAPAMTAAYNAGTASAIGSTLTPLRTDAYYSGAANAGGDIPDGWEPGWAEDNPVDPNADGTPPGLAAKLLDVGAAAAAIALFLGTADKSADDLAAQATTTEAGAGATAGEMDAYAANGVSQFDSVLDDEAACPECQDKADGGPYDVGTDGPPWHSNCECETAPSDTGESRSIGRYVRRWASRDQARDPDGRSASGGGDAGHAEIQAAEARGNSRAVTSSEFQSLANEGQTRLAALEADSRPATAITDAAKFDAVKASAYQSVQSEWGGQTINPGSGAVEDPAHGPNGGPYAMTVRDPGQSQIQVPIGASAKDFNAAMDHAASQYADKLQGSQINLGVFRDDAVGRVDIDPVAILATPHEVETIGAATHAVGGAYDFATGDGYFVPHVGA